MPERTPPSISAPQPPPPSPGPPIGGGPASNPQPLTIEGEDLGFLLGILVGEGSFGGDGRQPAITVRMHVRHEAMFERLLRIVPGSRLYGPYHHSGRSYFQWMVRGRALQRLVGVLDRALTPQHDEHAHRRFLAMTADYAPRFSRPAP